MKQCSRCQSIKPESDFSKNSAAKDGYQNTCKECNKSYYGKNKDDIRDKQNEYYKNDYYRNNKDKVLDKNREYYELHPEKCKENSLNYYIKNKESCLEKARIRYENNKEVYREKRRSYYHRVKLKA